MTLNEDSCERHVRAERPGAEAFKRDNPTALVKFFDTGHFAPETHHAAIAADIRDFLSRRWPKQAAR